MQKTILLTGGTGFIGQELGLELVRRGYRLRVLTRRPEQVRGLLPFPCELCQWPASEEEYATALAQVEAVFHLAGAGIADERWSRARKEELVNSRVATSQALCRAIKRVRPDLPLFIQSSAIGIYGDRGDEELDESSSSPPGFLSDLCRNWEAPALDLAKHGPRVIVMRIGLVLGHTGGALPKIAKLYHRGLGGILGNGRQWLSWIAIDDLVQLFCAALESSAYQGAVNAVAPEPCRAQEFHRALNQALQRRGNLPAPAPAIKLALGEQAEIVLASQRIRPKSALQSGFVFRHSAIGSVLHSLYADSVEPNCDRLLVRQWVPSPLDKVWDFFSTETNLERLTPPWLNFRVKEKSTDQIADGTKISYQLSLHGLPVKWVSKIEDWQPPERFCDRQIRGPYQLWHHEHTFESLAGGTLLSDKVQYKLPLGILGRNVAGLLVDRDLSKIFQYRRQVVAREFVEIRTH